MTRKSFTGTSKTLLPQFPLYQRKRRTSSWHPESLLNVDYKIATKRTIIIRVEMVLPHKIHPPSLSSIGGSIRQIVDVMDFTKSIQIPGRAPFFWTLKKPLILLNGDMSKNISQKNLDFKKDP